MWGLQNELDNAIDNYLPPITYTHLLMLAAALLALRALVHKILEVHFQITAIKPHHSIHTLEYSYFYHLSLVVLVLVEVEWNMLDLAIWAGSYLGVGIIRKAVHVVRIERELILSDCTYNKKIMQILSASKLYGLFLFLGSATYFILIQSLFADSTIKLSSLLLFPTMMLAIDSIFLLISSHVSQRELLTYYNHNINELSPTYKLGLVEKILGNSVRLCHYLNVFKLFFKSVVDRSGLMDRIWILSVINAFYTSSNDFCSAISRYRCYNRLLDRFNQIFRPTKTAFDQNCVICMSQLLNCRKLAPCGHLFHYKCLFEWVKTKKECPVCRNPIKLEE